MGLQIADHCHRSHEPVCDPGPGRGDPAKPLLAPLIMQSSVFQGNPMHCFPACTVRSPPLFRVWPVPKSSPANHAEIYGRAAPRRRRAVFNYYTYIQECRTLKQGCNFLHFCALCLSVPWYPDAVFASCAHVSDSVAASSCSNY